jgi:DNA invertase Pin-like site-specific DNA recombinase
MKLGYARVSTRDQNLNLQVDALKRAGCERIYQDVASGSKTERPALDEMLGQLRRGDVLVIWKLDRMGRSLAHLVELVGDLVTRKVGLVSLNDPIDTTSAQGRFVFNLFASLAEFERELIRERTQAGLSAARARGRVGGRPKGLSSQAQATAIAGKLHISKSTLYGYLRHRSVDIGPYNKPAQVRPESAAKAQAQGDIGTATVLLALRVQNNSKFVRGKKRVKEGLERYLRHQYAAKICPSGEYRLKVPYRTDADLDKTMEDLLHHIAFEADLRNCFSESNAQLEGSEDRTW